MVGRLLRFGGGGFIFKKCLITKYTKFSKHTKKTLIKTTKNKSNKTDLTGHGKGDRPVAPKCERVSCLWTREASLIRFCFRKPLSQKHARGRINREIGNPIRSARPQRTRVMRDAKFAQRKRIPFAMLGYMYFRSQNRGF
ncbi:MAG TPA: hypothetical protein DIW44_13950 [Anaerolineaceae bacterium]|nr:hypothetical protein [Anaerolineaceae bacterium]